MGPHGGGRRAAPPRGPTGTKILFYMRTNYVRDRRAYVTAKAILGTAGTARSSALESCLHLLSEWQHGGRRQMVLCPLII